MQQVSHTSRVSFTTLPASWQQYGITQDTCGQQGCIYNRIDCGEQTARIILYVAITFVLTLALGMLE
jgi:hypothetical protein